MSREPHERNRPTLAADDLSALDLDDLAWVDAQGLVDRPCRQRVHLPAHLEHQRANDGERERDRQLEGRALARNRVQVERALELLDDEFAYHIHAHAPTGDLGDDGRGGEARLEDHVLGLAVGHGLRLGGCDVALAHGALADLLGIDARPVIADLDDDAVSLLARAEVNRSVRGLARRQAGLGVLDAVVDRVAHYVDERVVDLLEDLLVEFGLAAVDHQLDVLAELLRQVADGARERLEDGVGREHAQAHALLLQVVDDHRRAGHVLRVVLHILRELAAAARHEGVDHVDVVADRIHELFARECLEGRLDP